MFKKEIVHLIIKAQGFFLNIHSWDLTLRDNKWHDFRHSSSSKFALWKKMSSILIPAI